MTANTKLTKEQKAQRKEWLNEFKTFNGELAFCGAFTVAKVSEFPGSKMAFFSVSVCSDKEQKFRRKVGEYHAMRNMLDIEEYVKLPSIVSALHFAEMLDVEYENLSW